MMRDFNDLQFFAAIVLRRGFSAAARALGMPKSRIGRRAALLSHEQFRKDKKYTLRT
jgi:DNA-binding transcriptional LysR family regulator